MTGNPCAHAALHRSLLEFWCRARGWTLKTIDGDLAVIDQGAGDVVWTAGDLFAAVVRTAGEPAELAALSWLGKRTYVVRHNPNCPTPFEIRLAGAPAPGRPNRGGRPAYGGTVAEAVARLRDAGATERDGPPVGRRSAAGRIANPLEAHYKTMEEGYG